MERIPSGTIPRVVFLCNRRKIRYNACMVIGLDEVGRGALAGPVMVGAVLLDDSTSQDLAAGMYRELHIPYPRDSKKLTKKQRALLYEAVSKSLPWAVGRVEADEIDRLGIVQAVTVAAGKAIDGLAVPELGVLVRCDAGLYHPFESLIPTTRHIKGDEAYPEIMLASVMAKVVRDRFMALLPTAYRAYGFDRHVGYGTKSHVEAIRRHGLSDIHRRTFCKSFL